MNFRLKNKKDIRIAALLTGGSLLIVALVLLRSGGPWTSYDFQFLDYCYRYALKTGHAPAPSFNPRVVYLAITDGSYNYFQKNSLDRRDLARVNRALAALDTEAVAYDVIFARPSSSDADGQFSESIRRVPRLFLPTGCAVSDKSAPFRWEDGPAYERFAADFLGRPQEKGDGRPFFASRALMQYDPFAQAAWGTGDISVNADADSVYRHMTLFLKVDDRYVPTLSLAMFLDWAGTRLDEVQVEWGKQVTIPVHKGDREKIVTIPIDARGRTYIPFVNTMGNDFPIMAAHTLLESFQQEDMRGNLMEFFEGAFVLVGDTAVGISDLGDTPLEREVPLVIVHASMLNALLTGTFYAEWPRWGILLLQAVICLFLGCAALPRNSLFLYGAGLFFLAVLPALAWHEFIHLRLFPVAITGALTLVVLLCFIVTLEVSASREQVLIRNTFARYVPEKVVRELLLDPGAIRLGGEEKEASVLFSDLANFTTISEKMSPTDLVSLLNEYLTAMTVIVLDAGGIIDKYEGDAIMAEFGIPLPCDNHADQAVTAALAMQQRLRSLRERWEERGQPALHCRVGVNTGKMLVGNLGSEHVMDYTVIGDEVNLASRLEEANKLYGTSIMISQTTYDQLTPGLFRTRPLDVLIVKGKSVSVKVYEVCGHADDPVDSQREAYYAAYQQALDAFLQTDVEGAKEAFLQALALYPEDLAAKRMLERVGALAANPMANG